jgi:hypothetical protein
MEDSPGGVLFFDESYLELTEENQGSWSEFFAYPRSIIIFLTLLVALLFVFMGLKRFWPIPKMEDYPYGKSKLIINSARLLVRGGHFRELYKRYLFLSLDSVGKLLHAPPGALSDRTKLLAFLDHDQTSRLKPLPSLMFRQAIGAADSSDPHRLIQYATTFFQWKVELELGSQLSRTNNPVNSLRSQ